MPTLSRLSSLFMMIILMGCHPASNTDDLQNDFKKMRQAAISEQAAIPVVELKPPTPTEFTAKSLPVPFGEPLSLVNPEQDIHPLQKFPLNALRFTGTLTKDNTIYAYIFAPNNKLYSVKVGDILGDRAAKITHINADKIELIESTTDDTPPKIITIELIKKE